MVKNEIITIFVLVKKLDSTELCMQIAKNLELPSEIIERIYKDFKRLI